MERKFVEWTEIKDENNILFYTILVGRTETSLNFELYEHSKVGSSLKPREELIIFRNDMKVGSLCGNDMHKLIDYAEAITRVERKSEDLSEEEEEN